MWDWLLPIIIGSASTLRSLANAVASAIQQIIDWVVGTFVRWVTAFVYLGQGIVAAYVGFIDYLAAVRDWVWVMLYITVPNWAASAVRTAATYTDSIIASVWHQFVATVDWLVQWARGELNQIYGWALRTFTLIISDIRTLAQLVDRVATRVFQLLTDPRALADWVAGEIVQAVTRWAVGNAEALTRWAIANALRGAVGIAALAERIITDLYL